MHMRSRSPARTHGRALAAAAADTSTASASRRATWYAIRSRMSSPRSTLAAMTSHESPEGPLLAPAAAGVVIRRETADDHREVREVHTRAFGDNARAH